MSANTNDRREHLMEVKERLLLQVAERWASHIESTLPKQLIEANLTIGSFVEDYSGNIEEFLTSLEKPLPAKRGKKPKAAVVKKQAVPKPSRSTRSTRSRQSSVESSIQRRDGRGESMFSVSEFPMESERSARQSRRITLRGLDQDVELICTIALDETEEDQNSNEPIAMESLNKEGLIKMRNAFKLAQEEAELLLAGFE